METIRKGFDVFYDLIKNPIFAFTEKDPEIAHELFADFLTLLHSTGLEKAVLGFNSEGYEGVEISNAAGFNKNGYIPPTALKALGFDRVVVGTVTGEPYEGQPRPRIKRFPKTNSLVNWMGLPGIGAEKVAEIMEDYGEHKVPITVNIAPTPGKKGYEILSDLRKSVSTTKDLPYVYRFELNRSCPNTGEEIGEYLSQLAEMLHVVFKTKNSGQEVYIKVSPDLTEEQVGRTIEVSNLFYVNGFTTTNTTTQHDKRHITEYLQKGGASGDAVYAKSLEVQKMFYEILGKNSKAEIIACGGINSRERMAERILHGADEIQIFTPLIFGGTKLLRELKS